MRFKAPRSLGVTGREMLVRTATALFNEQCAIAILANLPTRIDSRERRENIEALSEKTVLELRHLVRTLRENVEQMRVQSGIKLDQGALLALLDHLQSFTKSGHACYVPVWKLSEWLSKYDAVGFDPHCRISIDPHCIGKDYPGGFEVRQLEITLFEDMASLFNLAREKYTQTVGTRDAAKEDLKRAVALYRATVSAAFYFVECFMNELAADYVWKRRPSLSANDLASLTEWDDRRQRAKLLSTREKLVNYPRIITGSQYPPLDEGNCPELKFIVTKAKDFRDAIVHASTARKDEKGEFDKEHAVMQLKYDTTEQIVDAAVSLIRKIESATSKRELHWLIGRAEDGFFPARVFD
jgi:hypothetical protein